MSSSAYRTVDVALALLAAVAVEVAIYVVFATHVELRSVKVDAPKPPPEVAIAVQPILDDVPLLKLGGKKKPQTLPSMWRKPTPQKRYKDVSAASTKAEKTLPKEPQEERAPLAKQEEELPPEDAELAKEVDEDIPEPDEKEDINWDEEGAEDGVAEGTETDPLKAFVLNQYRAKILSWFKRGFVVPSDRIDCATLKGLNTRVTAVVGGGRTVSSYSVTGASGNSIFDRRVTSHMDRKVGQQLPPPPPKYPEFSEPAVHLNFSGKFAGCKDAAKAKPRPNPPDDGEADPPAAPQPAPEAPEPEPIGDPQPPPDPSPLAGPAPSDEE